MTRSKKFASRLAAALALAVALCTGFAAETRARGEAPPQASPAAKPIKARFEVLRMMSNSIQVRSRANPRELHTFQYSPSIRDQMLKLLNKGGYQYGDKVEIWYHPGGDVALKIKGKPSSKPA